MLRERRRHAHYKLNSRLDRKSSRGMIYENEELRLRTININAEVERGQSDIKRLRRENEHLRREIWTLRDECDRLNKRFKARLLETTHDHHGSCNARGSGVSGGCTGRRGSCDGPHSNSNSEESDSCDTCKGDNDDIYLDEYKYAPPSDCCLDGTCQAPATQKSQQQLLVERMAAKFNHSHTNASSQPTASDDDQQLHASFDHLSVVSEETLSNSEVLSGTLQPNNLLGYNQDINGSQSTLPSLVRPLTPLTPVEMVANELNDLQSAVPPLSYFENVVQQHMAPNSGSQSDSGKTTNSGKTVIQTNGWDYNLQSPFTQRKYPSNSSSSSSTSRSPAQALTTFVPPTSTLSPHYGTEPTTASRNNVPNIETVPITTVSSSNVATINSPKHFFSPLKPRLKLNTTLANRNLPGAVAPPVVPPNYNPPDIFVTNALASPYQRSGVITPTTSVTANCTSVLTTTNAAGHTLPQRQSPQTDSANLEAILNDIETISEDILAIQLEKNKSREYLPDSQPNKKLLQSDKNKKPYRSEMNLQLSYEGANPTITPTTTGTSVNSSGTAIAENGNNGRRARSLEREHTDSPSPNVPDPMAPFPNNRTYIGFEQLNATASTAKPPLPPSQLTAQANAVAAESKPGTPSKPAPPTPPTRKQTTPLSISHTAVTPSPTTNSSPDQLGELKSVAPPSLVGLTPNKSHLFAALANAAVAKRAQFRSAPLHLTRSLDTDRLVMPLTEQESPIAETPRRKGRRVSIVCNNTNKDGVSVAPATPVSPTTTTAPLGNSTEPQATNPLIMHLRQTSHSTPNSPHSMRRGSYSIIESPNISAPHHPHSHPLQTAPHAPHQQQQQRKSSISGQHRKASQDSPRLALNSPAQDLAAAAAAAVATRSKCSRRHSDSTVASGKMRLSIRPHHHHNHQQHLHPTALISTNPHHSHQDSHDTGTSISDRNSNSFGSSRESSTSFSMRSQRRKISISSHTGGKIPWCGCWGNGCL